MNFRELAPGQKWARHAPALQVDVFVASDLLRPRVFRLLVLGRAVPQVCSDLQGRCQVVVEHQSPQEEAREAAPVGSAPARWIHRALFPIIPEIFYNGPTILKNLFKSALQSQSIVRRKETLGT